MTFRDDFPFRGFPQTSGIVHVDLLDDASLQELNALLNWHCFTVDRHGRRFGNAAWKGKRDEPQEIPDRRIRLLHEKVDLSDKHVLELGCFEGIHTVGLGLFARQVTAMDARIENVVKTIVRCAFYGHRPQVLACNVEAQPLPGSVDVIFNVGVLYHLKDPVRHLFDLGRTSARALLLDTHVASEDSATETFESQGRHYRYKRFEEVNLGDPFSGVYDHAKWLTRDDLIVTLHSAGFKKVDVLETRSERGGPRLLLLATR